MRRSPLCVCGFRARFAGAPLLLPPGMPYFDGMLLTPKMTTPQRTGEQMAERRDDGGEDGNGTGAGIATKTRAKTKQPTPYRVLMLNDDYTPMEFVVLCLQRFFRMDMEAATRVMLHVHQKGVGVCGTFSYEVAETKVSQVMDFAQQNQHPLQCTLEKA